MGMCVRDSIVRRFSSGIRVESDNIYLGCIPDNILSHGGIGCNMQVVCDVYIDISMCDVMYNV